MDSTTPLVFLHAFPLHSGMWEAQLAAFGARPVLTPEFPGFGGRPVGASDLHGFARTVLEDMDRAGVSRAILVGLSMGGYVAFRIQELAPQRVAAVVLADTRAGPDDEGGRARRTEQARRVRMEGLGWLPDALAPALLGETSRAKRPAVVEKVRNWIRQEAHPEGVARALEAMRERPDSFPSLSDFRVPALVIVGEEDTLTPPSEARRMAEAIPGARLEILPEAGHLSNLETPEAFNRALQSFVG